MATTKTTAITSAMRLSARPITASTTSGTTLATSTSPSTTPMTMLTSTVACVERARRAHSFTLDVVSHLIGSRSESCHEHLHGHPWAHLLDSPLPFYYYHLFFPVVSSYLLHSELYPELDNPIVMESLCYSANRESEDAYDVSTSLTDPAREEDLLQRYQERVERLWQQGRVIKFCVDAGFLTSVQLECTSWQKTLSNSHNSQFQWPVVNTLCQEIKINLNQNI